MKKLLKKQLFGLLCISILVVAFFTHGYNMLRFPYYENDEGVYMSQAWSVLTQGKLAPYTYWYDHAPMGWFTIAVWTRVTGGFYTFGQSVNSGRVFMLFLQVLNAGLVFFIAKRITGKIFPAVVASLLFSISPLGIYFHRRILLDNIMTTFVLLSYAIILRRKITLLTVFVSALIFACGVLSKENAIFFIPGLLITLSTKINRHARPIALAGWIAIIGCVVSVYLLFAVLKGEFFPVGTYLGGTKPHVSLITSLQYQTSRKGGGFFDSGTWSSGSNFRLWMQQDPVLTVGGTLSFGLLVVTLMSRMIAFGIMKLRKSTLTKLVHASKLFLSRKKNIEAIHWEDFKKMEVKKESQTMMLLGLVLAALGFFFFLGRGGIVIEFYIVPMLPFLSLLIGAAYSVIEDTVRAIAPLRVLPFILAIATVCAFSVLYYPYVFVSRSFPQQSGGKNIYTTDQTKSQREALSWIRTNVKESDVLIFDNYAYLDLKDPKNPGKKIYTNSNWYWKVDLDPEIRDGVYQNNAETIDYVALTPQMNADLNTGVSPLTHDAVSSGHLVQAFDDNGWSVNIIRSTFPKQILARSWEWYKTAFMDNGRVIDHSANDITTSEGQSYAMLRSVWMNDQQSFDAVWGWTKTNLQTPEKLFTWRWNSKTQSTQIDDQGTAPDANIDVALSLLFASKQWSNKTYRTEAEEIIRAIWFREVGYMNGKPYLSAGNWAISPDGIILNPSYFHPAAYRIFADVTPDIPWNQLVDSSYDVLTQCTEASLNTASSVFLPPEWCIITSGGFVTLPTAAGISSSDYSYNAFRVPFHLALDYEWNQEPRAKEYLGKMNFLFEQWKNNKKLFAIYTHDGQPKAEYEAVAAYAGSLGAFLVTDPTITKEYYNQKIRGRFYEVDGKSFWDDPANYYTQNWGWFGTGLYSGRLGNLWK